MAAGGGGTAAGTGCWGRLDGTQARAVTRGDGGVMWDRGVGAGGGIGPAWAHRMGTCVFVCFHACSCVFMRVGVHHHLHVLWGTLLLLAQQHHVPWH